MKPIPSFDDLDDGQSRRNMARHHEVYAERLYADGNKLLAVQHLERALVLAQEAGSLEDINRIEEKLSIYSP